jgi:hypothetical protein
MTKLQKKTPPTGNKMHENVFYAGFKKKVTSLIAAKSSYTLLGESLFTCVRVEVQSPQGITDEQMLRCLPSWDCLILKLSMKSEHNELGF